MTQVQSTQDDQGANGYCHLIAREVTALERLLAGPSYFDVVLDHGLRELWDGLAEGASEEPSHYVPTFLDYVNVYCLEFTEIGERNSVTNEWNVVGARLLRTYGGPNATIQWHESQLLIVEVYWRSEHATRGVFAPGIAAAFEQLTSR
jgi:hypothetical protein